MYFYTINYNLETYVGKYFYAQDRKVLHRSKLYRIKIHHLPISGSFTHVSFQIFTRMGTYHRQSLDIFSINNAFIHRPSKGQI